MPQDMTATLDGSSFGGRGADGGLSGKERVSFTNVRKLFFLCGELLKTTHVTVLKRKIPARGPPK